MTPGAAPLWRPPLCLAHDDAQAGLCVEPPCTDGAVRCSLCGEGMGLHTDLLEQMGFDEDLGARTSRSSLAQDLKRTQDHAPVSGYLGTPMKLSERIERTLDELRARKLIEDGPRRMLLLTVAGRAVVRRIMEARRAEVDAAMDAAMARDATEGDDALGDFAADAARERRVFGGCPFRRA